MNEKLIELFCECFDACDLDDKIAVHNAYVVEGCNCENEVFDNDEDFFETFFGGKVIDAVQATQFGSYNYNDKYVWFDGYGNLETGDVEYQLPLEDAEDMAEYFIDNYSYIDHISDMEEFIDACKYGLADDESDGDDEQDQ